MNFEKWVKKYYPDENSETLHKMGHAFAAGYINMACSTIEKPIKEPGTKEVKNRCSCGGYPPMVKISETWECEQCREIVD